MKYITYFCLLLAIFIAACSETDNENTPEMNDLTGKWKLVETLSDPADGSARWITVKKMNLITSGLTAMAVLKAANLQQSGLTRLQTA